MSYNFLHYEIKRRNVTTWNNTTDSSKVDVVWCVLEIYNYIPWFKDPYIYINEVYRTDNKEGCERRIEYLKKHSKPELSRYN